MSKTTQSTSKRKRGEQSAEEPVVVRRSARHQAKGQESIIERAMNRKKVSSLELNSSRASQTLRHGSGRAAQADSADIANELQPFPAATGHCMNRSSATLANTIDQATSVGRIREGSHGLNPDALEFQSARGISSKDKACKVFPEANQGAPSSTIVSQTASSSCKLLSNKSHTQSSSVKSDKSKCDNPCEYNGPKDHHPEKPMLSSYFKHGLYMTGYVNCKGIRSAPETSTKRVSRSNVARSSHITVQASQSGSSSAAIAGIVSASTDKVNQSQGTIQASHTGSSTLVTHGLIDPNVAALNSQRIYPPSIPTIPTICMVAPRTITNPSFQMTPTQLGQDKGAVSLPPTIPNMHALNIPVQGRRSSTNYVRRQFVPSQPDPNLVTLYSRRTYSQLSPAVPQRPMVAPRATNQTFQNISPHFGQDKGSVFPLPPTIPTTNTLNVPTQLGIRSLLTNAGHQHGVDSSRLLSTKIYAGCTTIQNPVPENDVHHKINVTKNRSLNENDVAKATNLNQKSVLPSSQPKPTYYIQCTGSSDISTSPPPLLPLGERCQLCGIDLAFAAKGSDPQSQDLPFCAVLPCNHCYHDYCIRGVFGAAEPPCVRCLENEPPQGS